MLLTKDYYRVAFENRLRTNQLGDVDDYNLKLAKLKNNSYPLPYSFKEDYTEHLAHENLFRRFGTVIHTEIEEGTVVCMDVMPEPEIVDANQSYPSAAIRCTNINSRDNFFYFFAVDRNGLVSIPLLCHCTILIQIRKCIGGMKSNIIFCHLCNAIFIAQIPS